MTTNKTVEVSLDNILIHKPEVGVLLFYLFYGIRKFKIELNSSLTGDVSNPWLVEEIHSNGAIVFVHKDASFSEAVRWLERNYNDGITRGVSDDRRNK